MCAFAIVALPSFRDSAMIPLMATMTYYVVLPFVRSEEGELVAEEGMEAPTSRAAMNRAAALAKSKAGAIALSRSGDPALGEFEDAVILGRLWRHGPPISLASRVFEQ
ncbi:hypothetical protein SAMN05444161_9026 [Rhizobiales bacterium GAS191]|nr:hypothetical protein SAMN05519104_8043 [Rhizobiales bacterium GAS188]SEF14716.1 hypothetical protein SAMN05444161_9026 [Rhizobiales bacterium GAS191]